MSTVFDEIKCDKDDFNLLSLSKRMSSVLSFVVVHGKFDVYRQSIVSFSPPMTFKSVGDMNRYIKGQLKDVLPELEKSNTTDELNGEHLYLVGLYDEDDAVITSSAYRYYLTNFYEVCYGEVKAD